MNLKNVGVVGVNGRMGQEVVLMLNEMKISFTALVRKSEKAKNCKYLATLNQIEIKKCSVIIDFSSPALFLKIAEHCSNEKVPLVSGTTGLSEKQFEHIKLFSKKTAILWSPNMSIGIAIMKLAIGAFKKTSGFDFQIEELHHNLKKDFPSGTAKLLQAELTKVANKKVSSPISIRGGGIIGIHKIYAMADDEFLTFEHNAIHRKVFAKGSIQAANKLKYKKPGFYKLEDMFY